MADKKETEEKSSQVEAGAGGDSGKSAPAKGGLLMWLVIGAVVVICSVGGLVLSSLMGGTSAQDANAVQAAPVEEPFDPMMAAEGEAQKPWVFDKLDPIVANLDEPGVTRYVRVTVILEMDGKMDPIKGQIFLEEKKVVLQDWMTTYLAGLSLEDVRGSRNLNRIKREVLNEFNRILFGQDKTYVNKVLFKEFAVQ